MRAGLFPRPYAWPASAALHSGGAVIGGAVATAAIAALTYSFGPAVIWLSVIAAAAGTAMLIWPGAAALFAITTLYLNIPAILVKQHGVPGMIAGSFILLLGVPLVRTLLLRRDAFRTDRSFWLMLAFLGALLLSSFVAEDRSIALTRVREYCLHGLLLYWLFINAVRTLPDLKRVVWSLLIAGAFVSALSLYQTATKSFDQEFGGLARRNFVVEVDEDPRAGPVKIRGATRAQGPVDEPNRFAQMLVVLLPFSIAMARLARRSWMKIGSLMLGVMILTGALLTYSRGAFLSVIVASSLGVAWRWIRWKHLVVCVIAAAALLPIAAPQYLDRIQSLGATANLTSADPATQANADGSIRGRATEMMAALYVFVDHPIIGVGPAQFAPFYSQQYFGAGGMKFRDIQTARRAHSLYIEMAAETGILGLFVFMAIVGVLLRGLWRARARLLALEPRHTDLATAALLSVIIYLVTGVFLHLAFQRYYWLVLALASATLHVIQSEERRLAHAA